MKIDFCFYSRLKDLSVNYFYLYRKRLNRRPSFCHTCTRLCMKYMREKRVDCFSEINVLAVKEINVHLALFV